MKYVLRRLPLFILLALLLGAAATVIQVALLAVHNPQNTAWMRLRVREAREQGKTLVIKHTWVSRSEIPAVMRQAVVAAEDEKFYQHHGFDWDAMQKAWDLNEKKEKIKRGGSTITQQLAKNLYLSPSRTYLRKAREAVITWLMEVLLSKDRILELYLNSIEFGPGIFGVEEAARYHYGIHARQLSPMQACTLTALIPSPRRYRVTGPYVQRRAAQIARIIGYGGGRNENPIAEGGSSLNK